MALKFLPADLARDPSARRRFLREAQAVAQLDHPNVATIYETGESEGGRAFLALAFYEGETLQQKLERGPLPLAEAVGIARQIAQGLAAAHRREIVHRDIKPANIMVSPDGTVKIARLRARQAGRRHHAHPARLVARHPRLQVARADAGREGRSAQRSLGPGSGALRDGDRPRALRRRVRAGGDLRDLERAAAAAG